MTLEEFVLTYRGKTLTGDEGIVVNIADYYSQYIQHLEKKYGEYSLHGSKLVVCPLHNDNDPSFGLINHRFLKGVKMYHCFGCSKSGNVIRLHQLVQSKFYGRTLAEKDACIELAKMYELPIDDFLKNVPDDEDFESKYLNTKKHIDELKNSYTSQDFYYDLQKAKELGVNDRTLHLLNSASVKMIATVKQLY